MKPVLQALPLVLVFAAAMHAACADDAATGDTTSGNVTVSEPSNQACNGGAPDGYCAALSAVPESCECFDCVETAACTGGCNDDGACSAGEDCTCEDCYMPGQECGGVPPDGVTNNPAPGPGPGGGGPGGNGQGGAGGAGPVTATNGSTTASSGGASAGGGGAGGT